MSDEVKAVGPEPETYEPVNPALVTPTVSPYHVTGIRLRTWQRDRVKGGWSRVVEDGPQGTHLEVVSDAELVAFEHDARISGKDLLRGKKLEQRLQALLMLRALPHLELTSWADGPVFSPRSLADATGTP